MRIIDSTLECKAMRQNGPDMVVQYVRCNECAGLREFDSYPGVSRVNGYDVFVGPTCRKCDRSNLWVLYYIPAHMKDQVLI